MVNRGGLPVRLRSNVIVNTGLMEAVGHPPRLIKKRKPMDQPELVHTPSSPSLAGSRSPSRIQRAAVRGSASSTVAIAWVGEDRRRRC